MAAASGAPQNDAARAAHEGPVASMMAKRLRALKKKLNRIAQLEEQIAAGKSINSDQEEVLKSKPSVTLLIDEYEKLRQPILTAVQEELDAFEKELKKSASVEDSNAAESGSKQAHGDGPAEIGKGAEKSGEEGDRERIDDFPSVKPDVAQNAISDVVQLLYFSSLFDLQEFGEGTVSRWRADQELNSCLSYDPVTDDNVAPLTEKDLKSISELGRRVRVRAAQAKNHREAVDICLRNALNWINASQDIVSESLPVSFAYLKERISRILNSDFFTLEFASIETEVAAVAAASGEFVREGGQTILTVNENTDRDYSLQEGNGHPDQAYYAAADNYVAVDSPDTHEREFPSSTAPGTNLEQSNVSHNQTVQTSSVVQEEIKDMVDTSVVNIEPSVIEEEPLPKPDSADASLNQPSQQTYSSLNPNQRGYRGRGRFGGRGRAYYAVRGTVPRGRGAPRGGGRSNEGYSNHGEGYENSRNYSGDDAVFGNGGGNKQPFPAGGENYGRGGYGYGGYGSPGRFDGRGRGRRGRGSGRGTARGGGGPTANADNFGAQAH